MPKPRLMPKPDAQPAPFEPRSLWGADFHLDLGAWRHRAITGDSLWALEYFVRTALGLPHVDTVVLAGDITDSPDPAPEVCEFIRKQLDLLREREIRVLYVRGQHDMDSANQRPWLSALHDWPQHMHGCITTIHGQLWYGLDYQTADKLQGALDEVPEKVHGLICHQVWQEFMGDVTTPQGSLTQIPHAKIVFTGDLHKRKVLWNVSGASGQKMTVYSPGATNLRKIHEPPSGHFLAYDGKRFLDYQIPGRPILHVDFTDVTTSEGLEARLKNIRREVLDASKRELDALEAAGAPESLREPILRIRHTGQVTVVERATQELGSKVHVFEQIQQPEEEGKAPLTMVETTPETAVADAVRSWCQNQGQDPQDASWLGLQRLLTSSNMKAELAQMRSEAVDPKETESATTEVGESA